MRRNLPRLQVVGAAVVAAAASSPRPPLAASLAGRLQSYKADIQSAAASAVAAASAAGRSTAVAVNLAAAAVAGWCCFEYQPLFGSSAAAAAVVGLPCSEYQLLFGGSPAAAACSCLLAYAAVPVVKTTRTAGYPKGAFRMLLGDTNRLQKHEN